MLWSNGYSEYITTQKYIEWVFHRLSISFFLSFCISGFVVGVLCALLFSITLFKMRKTNEMYMHMDSLKRENNWDEFEWNRQKYWQKVKKKRKLHKRKQIHVYALNWIVIVASSKHWSHKIKKYLCVHMPAYPEWKQQIKPKYIYLGVYTKQGIARWVLVIMPWQYFLIAGCLVEICRSNRLQQICCQRFMLHSSRRRNKNVILCFILDSFKRKKKNFILYCAFNFPV